MLTLRKVVSLIITVLLSASVAAGQKGKPATGPSGFDAASFTGPVYTNGSTDTFVPNISKTLNYSCRCMSSGSGCSGYMRLEGDSGRGFTTEQSTSCSVAVGRTCTGSYTKLFSDSGEYRLRVACQDGMGIDAVQTPASYLTFQVRDACASRDAALCFPQNGVCSGIKETCVDGHWQCTMPAGYEPVERTLNDGQDNDCDGRTDETDDNQVLVPNMDGEGSLTILEYSFVKKRYDPIWSYFDGTATSIKGGTVGDINNDGVPDFTVVREAKNAGSASLEVWTYAGGDNWKKTGQAPIGTATYVNAVGDFDNDGLNEFIITNSSTAAFELWRAKVDGGTTTFAKVTTIHACAPGGSAYFIKPVGDVNGDGKPEILTHCRAPQPKRGSLPVEDIMIYQWNGTAVPYLPSFTLLGHVPSPIEMIDQSQMADVNGDGRVDAILCGNSKASHVLTSDGLSYWIAYTAPATGAFTQSCGAGNFAGDGVAEWFDVGGGLVRVFGRQGTTGDPSTTTFQPLWQGVWGGANVAPNLGTGAAGDFDNDGTIEFVHSTAGQPPRTLMWRYEPGSNPASFTTVYNFPAGRGAVVGKLR